VIDSWANSNNVDIGGGKFKGLLVGGVGVGGLIVGEVDMREARERDAVADKFGLC
jgi:uncharacterized protein GlcG (DUF336 family)